MTALRKVRRRAAEAQDYRCYYCSLPLWEDGPSEFAQHYGLTLRQALMLRSTAEHKVARCEGGGNARENIVAAHILCNQRRHCRKARLSAEAYRQFVAQRMSMGAWLAASIRAHFATVLDQRATWLSLSSPTENRRS